MIAVAAVRRSGEITCAVQPRIALPSTLSRGIPADMVVALSEEGKTFHVPGCRYLDPSDKEKVKRIGASEVMREG